MDGTTEPIIAIIGHPIAGNPTQFALETGFAAAQIDCRVLSVDLPPEKVSMAIAGMDAMNFRGIWVTPSCRAVTATIAPPATIVPPAAPPLLDFLQHAGETVPGLPWTAHSLKQRVWPELVGELLERQSRRCKKLWWIDEQADLLGSDLQCEKGEILTQMQAAHRECFSAFAVDQIEIIHNPTGLGHEPSSDDEDDVIVWARSPNATPQWQPRGQSITIDLNENWDAAYLADWDEIKADAAGTCLRGADVHAACLSKLTELLFDRHVDPEVFQDAVDEYLAV